jgi:hypothetical protein
MSLTRALNDAHFLAKRFALYPPTPRIIPKPSLASPPTCRLPGLSMLASKGKSRLTNRPTRLAGVDGRSSQSRRRRDLIATYVAALGGADKVSPTAMNDIVRAADLVAIAEKSRADALRGENVDLSALIRLEGAADRAVRRLGIKPGVAVVKPLSPLEYAARKAAEKAASASGADAA